MSKESFEAFMAELAEDASLREAVRGLAQDEKGVPLEQVVGFARGKGYEFSAEDVSAESVSELSEKQLDAVAGGGLVTGTQFFPKVVMIPDSSANLKFFLKW